MSKGESRHDDARQARRDRVARNVVARNKAKAQGLKRYFTGDPCKHGHIAERYIDNGGCAECKRYFRLRSYAVKRLKRIKEARQWEMENPDIIAVRKADMRKRHLKRTGISRRKQYWANPEKARATSLKTSLAHLVKMRREHPEELKARAKRARVKAQAKAQALMASSFQ